jgi:hypothetical protein
MLVKRNPFAREELHRERVYVQNSLTTCAWCGQVKKTPSRRPYLFQYRAESDGGRTSNIRGLFCSESCRKSYHEVED